MLVFDVGGQTRRALLMTPRKDWKAFVPMPLVIYLHDERSCPGVALREPLLKGFVDLLRPGLAGHDRQPESFLLAVPEGTSLGWPDERHGLEFDRASWNSGHRGYDGYMVDADDTELVDALIERIATAYQADLDADPGYPGRSSSLAVDFNRIYLVGPGNGGMSCYRIACELPSRRGNYHVRGIAVVGASVGGFRHFRDVADPTKRWVNDPNVSLDPSLPYVYAESTPDVLMIHGALDEDVPPLPEPPDPDGAPSTTWLELMLEDLGGNAALASDLRYFDLSFQFGWDLWATHFQALDPQSYDEGTIPIEAPHPDGVSGSIEYRSARVHAGSAVRYLASILDPAMDHAPSEAWPMARVIWDWLQNPSAPDYSPTLLLP